jgi:hypothetical protein
VNAPSNAVALATDRGLPMTAVEVRAHVNLIQEVMKAVMQEGTHYGVIPGTKKPTLYKAGAEVLAATFRIAFDYQIEDLSTPGMIRYRVKCVGSHQGTGITLGAGMGECSTLEEKYRWEKASAAQYEATPENMRRIKYYGENAVKQVQSDPWDAGNTALKMACKRAQIAATLNITAASDIFTQDLEDLPEHLRGTDEERAEKRKAQEEAEVAAKKRLEEALEALKGATTLDAVKTLYRERLQGFIDADDRTGADAWKAAVKEKNIFLTKATGDTGPATGAAPANQQEAGNGGAKAAESPSTEAAPADGAKKTEEGAGAAG